MLPAIHIPQHIPHGFPKGAAAMSALVEFSMTPLDLDQG